MSKEDMMAAELTARLKKEGIPTDEAPKAVTEESSAVEPAVSKMETTEFSDTEQEAMKKGWKPDGPKSADEFLRAEPLYEEIKKRGKELKDVRSQVDELVKMVSAMRKAGYEEKLDLIKQERANAIARSDLQSVDYLDDQLYAVRNELQKEQPAAPQLHPAALAFVEKYNDLINDTSEEAAEVKAFIDFKDKQLGAKGLSPEDHMKTLEQQLHKRYPERFESKEEKSSVAAVESDASTVRAVKKTKHTFSSLNQEQKEIYKYMEKKGGMAGEEYIKQLAELGLLK